MDKGNGEMREAPNEIEMPGLQGKAVELGELSELASKIRQGNRYDALDTGNNRAAVSERKSALSGVKNEMRHSRGHMNAFVAMHEGNVVGFLAVETTPAGKQAAIQEMWTSLPGRRQRAIVGTLLTTARNYLVEHGYPKLKAEPLSASTDFSVVASNPELGRFLRISEPDAEPTNISIAPEEPEGPEAAGDDFDAPLESGQ
jgi:hypothetical protein